MALARVQYQADGQTDSFSVPFPYISKSDIKVMVDGAQVPYEFISQNSVALEAKPQAEAIVDIRRETEREDILVDYKDGSTLTETDLDKAARQSFYLAQEAFDQTGSTMAVAEDGSFSAGDRRISLLGYPNSDDDAATQGYVKDQLSGGYDAHAEASRAAEESQEAQTAASTAVTAKNQAVSAAGEAAADAEGLSAAVDSASNSADTAVSAKNSAQGYLASVQEDADAAEAARSSAITAKNAAQSAAQGAQISASNASDDAQTASSKASSASSSASQASSSASSALTYKNQATSEAEKAKTYRDDARDSRDAAASSASAASTSAGNAATSEQNAEDWAASVNMPNAGGHGGEILRQKPDETGFEYIDRPAQPNLLVDGNLDYWFEGTTQTEKGYGSATMWFMYHHTTTVEKKVTREEVSLMDAPIDGNPQYFLRHDITSVDKSDPESRALILQRLEGIRPTAGKTVTASFYARSADNLEIGFDLSRNFAPSGTRDVEEGIGATKWQLDGEWRRYSTTFTLPVYQNSREKDDALVEFRLWMSAGENFSERGGGISSQAGQIDVARIKFEVCDVPTYGGFLPKQDELWRLNRYFVRRSKYDGQATGITGMFNNATDAYGYALLPREMYRNGEATISSTDDFDLEPFDKTIDNLTVAMENRTLITFSVRGGGSVDERQGDIVVFNWDKEGAWYQADARL